MSIETYRSKEQNSPKEGPNGEHISTYDSYILYENNLFNERHNFYIFKNQMLDQGIKYEDLCSEKIKEMSFTYNLESLFITEISTFPYTPDYFEEIINPVLKEMGLQCSIILKEHYGYYLWIIPYADYAEYCVTFSKIEEKENQEN